MKKLLLACLFLLICTPAFGLIVTDNVDRDNFGYEVAFSYATDNISANTIAWEIPVESTLDDNFYYVVPRDGRVVGMSVAGSAACTAGAATFDITINGAVTGIQTVIEPTATTARSAVGINGAADPQYAYIRQDRADSVVARGFRVSLDRVGYHDAEHPFGKATALTAGNRIGVTINTTTGFTPTATTDYLVVIYVLE